MDYKNLGSIQIWVDNAIETFLDKIHSIPASQKIFLFDKLNSGLNYLEYSNHAEDDSTSSESLLSIDDVQFSKKIHPVLLKAFETLSIKLKTIPQSEAQIYIDSIVYQLKQKKLFEEIGGEKASKLEKWLLRFLKHQAKYLHIKTNLTPFDVAHKSVIPIWWKGTEKQLKQLLLELANCDYIEGNNPVDRVIAYHFLNSNKESFYKLNGEPIQPIWWKHTNRLLIYFMDELKAKGLIDKESQVIKLIKEHFINKDKQPFSNSLAQNRSGISYNAGEKPKGYEAIDRIINSL